VNRTTPWEEALGCEEFGTGTKAAPALDCDEFGTCTKTGARVEA
jgi:hypothetical protein